MMTKREAEFIEQIVRSMTTEREYWGLVGWLGNGTEGSLWTWVRRRRPALSAMRGVGQAALSLSAKQSMEAADGR
jgi:hypothetical protein